MSTAYPSTTISFAHPARLAATSVLHGLRPGFTNDFRYLELGCGDGSHLWPLAAQFPEAVFVGVDVDRELIDLAMWMRDRCGLVNVRLIAADFMDLDLTNETFDYVVSHGVYSWVAKDVQQRLLMLSARHLHPSGIAYTSYNAMPGWSVRGVVRDVMRTAARTSQTPEARLRAAKGALSRLARHASTPRHPYSALLSAEVELAREKPDGYLLREQLAEYNEAIYVGEFARRAATHGLSYLAECLPATPEGELEVSMLDDLRASGLSRVDAEEMVDVVAYRQFRATLLCHTSTVVTDGPRYEMLRDTGYFAGNLRPTSNEPLLGRGKTLGFETPSGALIECDRPLLKTALLVLAAAWPQGLRAQEIVTAAMTELRGRGLLDSSSIEEAEINRTVDDLIALCQRRHIELLPWTPRRIDHGDKPIVAPYTRMEAERSSKVTSPRHEPVTLDPVTRLVVRLLDGERGMDELITGLREFIESGEGIGGMDMAVLRQRSTLQEMVTVGVLHAQHLGLLILTRNEGAER